MPATWTPTVVSRGRSWRIPAAALLFLALIVACALPASARATTLERMSIEELSRRATMVVEGTVVATAAEQTPDGLRTAVRLRVRELLKGVPSAFKTVYVPGGMLADGSQVVVEAMPSFRPGDECYVFVDVRGWVMAGFQGKVAVAAGHIVRSGATTATMSRRIAAALRTARSAAPAVPGARRGEFGGARGADPWPPKYFWGHVTDATDDSALSGVLVKAAKSGTSLIYTTSTDATGYYHLDLDPDPNDVFGKYAVEVSKAGYATQKYALWLSLLWTSAIPGSPPDGSIDWALKSSSGPTITAITPGVASAGTDTHVTISGTGFGSARGKVDFSYGRDGIKWISASDISSWTDTSINCAVPTGRIDNYSASAGSGPVVVTTPDGQKSNGYDMSVTFGYLDHKWTSAGATYFLNTSGIDEVVRHSLVDAAAEVWNNAGSRFVFGDGGETGRGKARDDMNVISWDWLADGVVAMASSYYDSAGNMDEADIQFSNAFSWTDGDAGAGTQDIQSITEHELGHWLKLLDQYMPADKPKIMYGYENQMPRVLDAGAVAGINWIYPGGGPSPTPTPTPTPPPDGDTVGPVCAAKNVTVKHDGTCKLYYRVYDAQSAQVTQHLAITKSGVVKQSWSTQGYGENFNGWWWVKYTCRLPKGAYRIVVTGKDLAGNSASVVGRATLTVK
jgi:hypothetical protein